MGEGAERVCVRVGQDFIEVPQLKSLVDQEVEKANENLEEHERIKKYVIINRKFSEAAGEMTPTLKIKKKAVISNFEKEIEKIYL